VRIHDIQLNEALLANPSIVQTYFRGPTEEELGKQEMSDWTIDEVVEMQRQEEEQIEQVISITLPELRAGDQITPLEQIQLRVYRPLLEELDGVVGDRGSDPVTEGSPPIRWKEVRWKAFVRNRELFNRVRAVIKILACRGPSEKMLWDWKMTKQIWGTDPISEEWDAAFGKAVERIRQWEAGLLKIEEKRERRRRFRETIQTGASSWCMKRVWDKFEQDYEATDIEQEAFEEAYKTA
jgi:hypothetical protein